MNNNLEYNKLHKTKDGNKYIIVENNHNQLCYVEVLIDRGSLYDVKGKEGIHHFLEHLIAKGSIKISGEEYNNKMSYYGAVHNAYTEFNETAFMVSSLSENIVEVTDLLIDSITSPIFLYDDRYKNEFFEEERNIILDEFNMYNSPESKANSKLINTVYGDTSDTNYVIGTEDSLAAISYDDIVNAYMQYNKEDITLIINVHIDDKNITDDVLNTIINNYNDKFNMFQDKSEIVREKKVYKPVVYTGYIKGLPYTVVSRYYGIKVTKKEVYTIIPNYVSLLQQILFNEIREKLGLCYYVMVQTFSSDDPNERIIAISSASEKPEIVLKLIDDIINNIDRYITEDMFIGSSRRLRRDIIESDRQNLLYYKVFRKLYNEDFDNDKFLEGLKKYSTRGHLNEFINKLDLSNKSVIVLNRSDETGCEDEEREG